MSVDLSKARAGDTVKFRCGGKSILHAAPEISPRAWALATPWSLSFNDDDTVVGYRKDGRTGQTEHPFDIMEIIPKPFDWSSVKPGTAFRSDDLNIYFFVGRNPLPGKEHNLVMVNAAGCSGQYTHHKFTRAPEHDISVPA